MRKNILTYCLIASLAVTVGFLGITKRELIKAQPRIAMANMVIAAANSAPTNTSVLFTIVRQSNGRGLTE